MVLCIFKNNFLKYSVKCDISENILDQNACLRFKDRKVVNGGDCGGFVDFIVQHTYCISQLLTLSQITNTNEFYRWMRDAFIPMYYPLTNYADQELTSVDKQWFGDMANIRVGPGRIRQVRMNKGTEKGIIQECSVQINNKTKYAIHYWYIFYLFK